MSVIFTDRHFLHPLQLRAVAQQVVRDVAHDFRAAVEISQRLDVVAERGKKLIGQRDRQGLAGADPESQAAENVVIILQCAVTK